MTTIKASCPICGDVELTPAQLRLVVCDRSELSYYSFLCTTCSDTVRKPADDEVVALLVSGGVLIEHWAIPAEAMEDHSGPVISYDDVLDFALALSRMNVMAAVTAAGATSV